MNQPSNHLSSGVPQGYRYVSARALLSLTKLNRMQAMPPESWAPAESLRHVVFVSHRWGNYDDPDPSKTQLTCLQKLVRLFRTLAELLSADDSDASAVRARCARVPSLAQHGALQAAHLVFRGLCAIADTHSPESVWDGGNGILDQLGIWYDFSCLPQQPRTPAEELVFAESLLGIGELITSPSVTTLILRRAEDDYLERGWCFAESSIAASKPDPLQPIVLRTDLFGTPFSSWTEELTAATATWSDANGGASAWQALASAIQPTAVALVLPAIHSLPDFSVATADAIASQNQLLAWVHSRVARLKEGARLDLAIPLAGVLENRGLGCRSRNDAILVALLLLTSLVSPNATGDLAVYPQALRRWTDHQQLNLVRKRGQLCWSDG